LIIVGETGSGKTTRKFIASNYLYCLFGLSNYYPAF
jgi:hypothetical protein